MSYIITKLKKDSLDGVKFQPAVGTRHQWILLPTVLRGQGGKGGRGRGGREKRGGEKEGKGEADAWRGVKRGTQLTLHSCWLAERASNLQRLWQWVQANSISLVAMTT